MTAGQRSKVGLILFTLAVCGGAAITQRWLESRRAAVRPGDLFAVVLEQMDAFRKADYPRAFRQVSNNLQEKFNVESYSSFARHDHPELRRATRIEFGPVRSVGRRALVPVYFFLEGAGVIPCTYSLVHEEDGWKIDGVRVHGQWPSTFQLRGSRI
ncbi:MAG: DUF4864 domain-containing protein [Chthoniobacteraceae bacterium]